MSFIQFESSREKEKIRQELREAREALIEKAKQNAERRAKQDVRANLRGEKDWMLPSVSEKIRKLNKSSKKSSKKMKKKSKKSQSKKKRKHKSSSSDSTESESDSSDDSTSSQEIKLKKSKKSKKRSRRTNKSSDSDSNKTHNEPRKCEPKVTPSAATLSIEQSVSAVGDNLERDDWMLDSNSFKINTFTRERTENKPNEKVEYHAYDPAKSGRELNPYWKSTGTGLPAFKKPSGDSDEDRDRYRSTKKSVPSTAKNWKKSSSQTTVTSNKETYRDKISKSASSSGSSDSEAEENGRGFLTDQQMNDLGAKVVKAEILGNMKLAQELKEKLNKAHKNRAAFKQGKHSVGKNSKDEKAKHKTEHILLTHTDEKGISRPLPSSSQQKDTRDSYGPRQKKQKRFETHVDGERVRYFPEDDKYDIKQMFEREKYASASDSNLQFANIVSKHKSRNDDLDDLFCDNIRKGSSIDTTDKKDADRAIAEHQKLSMQLDNCDKCFDSGKMDKKLIVSMGEKVYLALPWQIGLQPGHCIIVPTQHISCCTQLDEDLWEEISNFRKALTRMYAAQKKDVIFFEIANRLHRRPHLSIHCIPIPNDVGEMAPFYFKKAIEESEHEWSINKQLVSLRNKGLRSSIPKGLPYFWVNFGMDIGFAHVIEDENRFPQNYAQEIIGGMLNLDANKWRRPQKEQNIIAKVKTFADGWKKYDCTI